jgi:hypothetical protein
MTESLNHSLEECLQVMAQALSMFYKLKLKIIYCKHVARHSRGLPGLALTRINKIEKCQETARGQQGGTGLPYK